MILRGYGTGDLDAMHALDVVCFERPFRFSRSAMRRFAEANKALIVLAEIDGTLAGFCILHLENAEEARAGYVVTLDVAPAYRKRGIARAIMQRIEQQAADAGCSLIVLHVFTGNADAIAFYERLGFELSHREKNFYGIGRAALVYVKRIIGSSETPLDSPPFAIQ
jgi:ribosomal-protein-alanine N-acetyltransferase